MQFNTVVVNTRDAFLINREKKWVKVGPPTCSLKVFKWVPGEEIIYIFYNMSASVDFVDYCVFF